MIPFRTAGGMIDLAALRPQDVTLEKIGDALSKVNRFTGRTPEPWSVAAHSVLVARLCPPEHRAWGLLHDAHEVFLGDITSPAVELMAALEPRMKAGIAAAKEHLDRAILIAWDVHPVFSRRVVEDMDKVALAAEMHVLLDDPVAVPVELSDAFDAAVSLVRDYAALDWRGARALWTGEAERYAGLDLLRLPA